jgi:hypothetical protein
MTRSFRITTEPHHIDAVDEFEAINSWFQMIQFIGFFIQEYEDAKPVGEKGNRRLVIAENKTGGQLVISVKEESKADMIRLNQELRKKVEGLLAYVRILQDGDPENEKPKEILDYIESSLSDTPSKEESKV